MSTNPKFNSKYRSVWREQSKKTWTFYCPHCCVSRRIGYFPKPSPKHVAQVALTSVLIMTIGWNWMSWKGLVSFLPLWVAFETIYRLKFRAAVICPHCGFDAFLYKIDLGKARQEILSFWEKQNLPASVPPVIEETETTAA